MLVLSRRLNETIVIGEGIRITIVQVRGEQVRLSIEAPRDVTVLRSEVKLRLEAESQIARPTPGKCYLFDGALPIDAQKRENERDGR